MEEAVLFSTLDKVLAGLFIECDTFLSYIHFFSQPPRQVSLRQVERCFQDLIRTISNVFNRFPRWSHNLQKMKELAELKFHITVIQEKLFNTDNVDVEAVRGRWAVAKNDIELILQDIKDMFQQRRHTVYTC